MRSTAAEAPKVRRVAFDIDGVLRDLMTPFVAALDPPRKVEEITEYGTAVTMAGGPENFYEVLDNRGCWLKAAPYLDMLRVYRDVVLGGAAVLLISANPSSVGRKDTLTWLDCYEIVYDELHFCQNKLTVKFDLLIEDQPETAFAVARADRASFLVERPWTQKPARRRNLFWLPADGEKASAIVQEVLDTKAMKEK